MQTFDVMVSEKPINLAYGGGSLPLHMDLLMYESPPGIQMLHCIKFVASMCWSNDVTNYTGTMLLVVNHFC